MNNSNEAIRLVCLEAAQKLRTYAGIYTGDKQARRLVDELSNIADAIATSAAPEHDTKEALRTEVQLRGRIHMLNDEIEALKEGAAPERSEKLVGNIDTSNITSAIILDTDKMKLIFKSKAACEKFQTQLYASIYEAAPEADSSSAAPSDDDNSETRSYQIAAKLRKRARAAPSPTKESLSAIPTWRERQEASMKAGRFVGFPGEHMEAEIADLRAALATPRQTEDGGLSAAIMALKADYKGDLNFRGAYLDGFDAAIRATSNLASTFAPKETAAQGGVPRIPDTVMLDAGLAARRREGATSLDIWLAMWDAAPVAQGGVPEGWHKVGGAVMPQYGDYVLVLTTDADDDPIAVTANYNGKTLFLGEGGRKVKPATHWSAIPAAPTGASK